MRNVDWFFSSSGVKSWENKNSNENRFSFEDKIGILIFIIQQQSKRKMRGIQADLK